MKNYLYKATFASAIKIIIPTDHDKYLAKASLDNLQQYFNEPINTDENPDLLYIALTSFNGGIINLNDDGVSIATAIELAKKFKNKYIDEEHNKGNVIGNIVNYGFTKHGSNSSITEQEAARSADPINVVLSGYLWRVVNEDLCDLVVEASNTTSPKYNTVSGSWEILFNDYDIVIGQRNIAEGKLINDTCRG